MRIFLLGFMASGKSSLGPVVAHEGRLAFADLDAEIEAAAGRSVAEIFRDDGLEAFRDLESRALERWAAGEQGVLATGGGIVERRDNHPWLRQGHAVYLAWPWEALAGRLAALSPAQRPLLAQGPAALERLWRRRDPLYRELARQILPMTIWRQDDREARLRAWARQILAAARRA